MERRVKLARTTPSRQTSRDRKGSRKRRWQCRFCPVLNAPEKKKCAGCGIRRAVGRKSASKTADELWARLVKAGGRCEAAMPWGAWSFVAPPILRCSGPLEAAHIVPRRHRTTRWDPANGRALCHACHRFFTDHEKAWRDFIGPEWERLWSEAQRPWSKTYPITELRAALIAARKDAA